MADYQRANTSPNAEKESTDHNVVRRVDESKATVLPHYVVERTTLEFGASMGNAHCWVSTRGNGSIQDIFSTDLGKRILGNMTIRYVARGHQLLGAGGHGVTTLDSVADVQLRPITPGTMEIHPAYQRHLFTLPEELAVQETVFVPLFTGEDPAVAYYQVKVTNQGLAARTLRLYAFAHLRGGLGSDVAARYDPEQRALIVANRNLPEAVRVFGCTLPVNAYETTFDFGRVYDVLHATSLSNKTEAQGDILGALQVDLDLPPQAEQNLVFLLAFASTGAADAIATYQQAQDADMALARTIANITWLTGTAQVLTPNRTINEGVLWSKVNMLRVMARYPQGPAFTNDPGISSAVVGRDTFWFTYGNDHFLPDFSRTLLEAFAARQYPDGRIPEVYHAVTNTIDDYGLNINDDTPLFILAVNHHFRSTGDVSWLEKMYPAVCAAAHYIISQEDDRGLVFCTTRDPRGNMWAIASWRNVIPEYTLNGAVTEINAECMAALRATGLLSRNLGRPIEDQNLFLNASERLRAAMNTHLINPQNGLYYLTIDADGITHTEITGDQVFPIIFRCCSEEVGYRIITRLHNYDFWTPAGLRTISAWDPLYNPAQYLGLLGGVWPGLSWWYAFAASRYHPELMVQALTASFEHYSIDPKKNNTVPGQFSEWFDGESLVNRGMRLSPWEPPRFLWAAVEGVCGVVIMPGKLRINPLIPLNWRWVALRRLPYHGTQISYFATREDPGDHILRFHIYATAEIETEHTLAVFTEDVTDSVRVLNPDIRYVALRRPGEVVLLVGNLGTITGIVPLELENVLEKGKIYETSLYESENYSWQVSGSSIAEQLCTPVVTVEAGGFRILRFEGRPDR